MMPVLLRLFAGLVALAPVVASAQETGTRINRYPKAYVDDDRGLSEGDRARQMMLDFSRCLITSNEARVRKFIADFPETTVNLQRGRSLANDSCLGEGRLTFNETLLRPSLYTAFYLQDFRYSAPPLRATPIDYKADAAGEDADLANRYIVLREFAECVVRAAPAESRAAVIGPIGSKAEDEAYRALMPSLGPCLPQGSSIKVGRTMLSGLLAEVLYRLSSSASSPVSVAGKS